MGNTFERLGKYIGAFFGLSAPAPMFPKFVEFLCRELDEVQCRFEELSTFRVNTLRRICSLEASGRKLEDRVGTQEPTKYYEKHSRNFETRLHALEQARRETPATGPRLADPPYMWDALLDARVRRDCQPSPYSETIAKGTQDEQCVRCGKTKRDHFEGGANVRYCHSMGYNTQTFVPREQVDPYKVCPRQYRVVMYSKDFQVVDVREKVKPQPSYLWGATCDALLFSKMFKRVTVCSQSDGHLCSGVPTCRPLKW